MSVVFRKSTRKMTFKCTVVVLLVAVSRFEGINAAAFSNVVVQRGPVEYINYNPSALAFDAPQLAQLTAGALEQVVSLPAVSSIVSSCVSPCVIPNAPVSALASFPSTGSAKIIAYKPTLQDDARGYTYAYAVYDDQTGDKKTQSEHSDGSVVQGQYSFIQPDGIRRVVVYTADDVKGFNAVVRNLSPEAENPKEEIPESSKEGKNSPPCTEVKNEHLTNADNSEDIHSEEENLDDKKSEEQNTKKNETDDIEAKHDKPEANRRNHSNEEAPIVAELADNNTNIPNALLSYNEIINCLQAKLRGAKNVVSPLTYVLIPSSKSPC